MYAIRSYYGYKTLLLVTGEHERKSGMDYFREILPVVKPYVAYLMMEVQPLATEEYRELVGLGLDGVMVYQETYHAPTYAEHHLHGKKTRITSYNVCYTKLLRTGFSAYAETLAPLLERVV